MVINIFPRRGSSYKDLQKLRFYFLGQLPESPMSEKQFKHPTISLCNRFKVKRVVLNGHNHFPCGTSYHKDLFEIEIF